MHPKVELGSLAISKSEEDQSAFIKYDIDASLDEVKTTENFSKLKFSFTILSDPKNIRLIADGLVTIVGNPSKREEVLVNDEKNIPKILNQIYQNLFPTFFLVAKCIEVPCPPYMLGGISKTSVSSSEQEIIEQEIQTEEKPKVTKEKPQEIQTEEKPQEIQTEEKPQEIQTEEKPQEIQTEEKPQEIQTEEKPQEIQTEEKPQEIQTEEKPANERLQELLEKSSK